MEENTISEIALRQADFWKSISKISEGGSLEQEKLLLFLVG